MQSSMTRLKRRRFQQGRTTSVMVDMMDTADPGPAAFTHTVPPQVWHVAFSDICFYTDGSIIQRKFHLLIIWQSLLRCKEHSSADLQ